jgi:hypothetical protein
MNASTDMESTVTRLINNHGPVSGKANKYGGKYVLIVQFIKFHTERQNIKDINESKIFFAL